MQKLKGIKKTVFSVTLFNFLGAGIGFVVNALLARVVSVEDFGKINFMLSINAILMVVFQFGFNNSLVVYYNKTKSTKDEIDSELIAEISNRFWKYIFSILCLVSVVVWVFRNSLQFDSLEILFVIFSPFILAVYYYVITIYQATGEWKKYNIFNVLTNLSKALALIVSLALITFYFSRQFKYEDFLATFLIYTAFLLIVGINLYKKIKGHKTKFKSKISPKDFYSILLNIGFTNLIIALAMRVDNIFIEELLGMESVAIYSAANSLALMFPLVTGSITRVLLKEVSKDSEKYLRKILNFQKKYRWYFVALMLSLILLSPFMINLVFGDRYALSIPIFQILIIAYIGGVYFTPLESYFYNENSRLMLKIKFIQLIFLLVFGYFLIIEFELYGFAVAVVITRLFAWLFFYSKAKKKIYVQNN